MLTSIINANNPPNLRRFENVTKACKTLANNSNLKKVPIDVADIDGKVYLSTATKAKDGANGILLSIRNEKGTKVSSFVFQGDDKNIIKNNKFSETVYEKLNELALFFKRMANKGE